MSVLDKLKINTQQREKKSFYCSDYGKTALDLFFAFKNITKTNPARWNDQLRWGAGSGAEMFMLRALIDGGFVHEWYEQDFDGRVDFKIGDGIPVTGYMDCVMKNGEPVEIKTINNKNSFDISKYKENNPRESYVGQLSMYNYYLKKDVGHLFVSSVDGLNSFWFDNIKQSDGVYRCGNTIVDLNKEFERWINIWNITHNFKPSKDELVPKEFLFQYRYKIPVNEINWRELSSSDISKARNNQKVIGDWQIQYSEWKDLIIKLQGEKPGYSVEEILLIKEKTSGYTTWNKK